MLLDTLAIVGVGLIGGSVGLAARRAGAARRVLGVGSDPNELERARAAGAIDEAVSLESAGAADLVIVCVPVNFIPTAVLSLARFARPGFVVTDVGSTKARIVNALRGRLPAGMSFVGGHPLAGSEKRGPDYAQATLFDRRRVVLTPIAETDPAAVDLVRRFWEALGAQVSTLLPEMHDEILATTSHMPHLLAVALAESLPEGCAAYTATGFRDATRMAASGPEVWAPILEQNRDAMLIALDRMAERLAELRAAIAADDRASLEHHLTRAKQVRDALGS